MRECSIISRAGCYLILSAVLLAPQSFAAQQSAPPGEALTRRYEQALKTLDEQRLRADRTREEQMRLSAEAETLRAKRIDNAARVQDLEAAAAATGQELEILERTANRLEADLARDRDRVTHILAVLQRLDTEQPPALALRPGNSLAAARGVMQMGAMLPPVYREAVELSRRLRTLSQTRVALGAKRLEAETGANALKAARGDLDRLLASRSQEAAEAQVKLTELNGIIEEISRQTSDLKNLMERIATLRGARGAPAGMKAVGANNDQGGLRRGSLRVPVVGSVMPGDPAGPGLTPGVGGPSGLWFEAVGLAEVVSPGDGEVVFAGSYQKFGYVLILELNGGYHLTLAGLGRIDVRIGDLVLTGEPVGILAGGSVSRLYLELRRNGQAVDPAPWIGADLRKAKRT